METSQSPFTFTGPQVAHMSTRKATGYRLPEVRGIGYSHQMMFLELDLSLLGPLALPLGTPGNMWVP